MYFLTEKLPKPNYNPVKIMYHEKKNFFNTIGVNNEKYVSEDYALNKLPKINKDNRT